jgi:hypothetical protein
MNADTIDLMIDLIPDQPSIKDSGKSFTESELSRYRAISTAQLLLIELANHAIVSGSDNIGRQFIDLRKKLLDKTKD